MNSIAETFSSFVIFLKGGPLMGEDHSNQLVPYSYLAGIVSFGPAKCGTPGLPGVYTVKF